MPKMSTSLSSKRKLPFYTNEIEPITLSDDEHCEVPQILEVDKRFNYTLDEENARWWAENNFDRYKPQTKNMVPSQEHQIEETHVNTQASATEIDPLLFPMSKLLSQVMANPGLDIQHEAVLSHVSLAMLTRGDELNGDEDYHSVQDSDSESDKSGFEREEDENQDNVIEEIQNQETFNEEIFNQEYVESEAIDVDDVAIVNIESCEDDFDDVANVNIEPNATRAATFELKPEFDEFEGKTDELNDDEETGATNKKSGEIDYTIYPNHEWPTMKDCREFMKDHAIHFKFEFRGETNNNERIDYMCRDEKCGWRLYVRVVPKQLTARMRLYINQHTCKADENDHNIYANASWVLFPPR